jgi:Holliday junction resolvase RusA-like endonuclease
MLTKTAMAKKTTATRTTKSEAMGAAQAALIVFPLEPVAASRPRVTRWGTYHAKPYKEWLTAAGKSLAAVDARFPEGHLAVEVEIICTRARTSKLSTPKGDVDNYAKAALDAITHAGIWPDDKWVVDLLIHKRFAAEGEPARTEVHIQPCD